MISNPNVTQIARNPQTNKVRWPDLLPAELDQIIRQYDDLVLEGEAITPQELAERIKGCARTNRDIAHANFIKRWAYMALALIMDDSELPETLPYAGVDYPIDSYARILGDTAMNHIVAMKRRPSGMAA
ncbi:MAG: hypothetical protein AWU57_596 [Marinobacter sp. T13-3]|nr:MAG: hypothetical protein AWU57_596 [Marinobacter sp. T13-3]